MNNERIMSIEAKSRIYHKPGCRYIKKIKRRNLISMPMTEANECGYRVCKYCNSINHHYLVEQPALDRYERSRNMKFNFIDGILYVKSELGCWKIVYSKQYEDFVLYHRNNTYKELDFEHPQFESYHRQIDKYKANSIQDYLSYIYNHDKYKAAIARGEEVTTFSSKKYARKEARAKKRREINRVNNLFKMLESQNPSLKYVYKETALY